MTATRKWSLLATVLVLAIFAAGWFLLVSPKRSEAADLKTQAATQDEENSRLEQKIQLLQAQQAELPQQRAKLAVMRRQIPDNPALPTLIRNLTAASRKSGSTIFSMEPSLPVALVSAQPAAPVTATTGAQGSTSGTATEAGASSTSTPVTPAPVAPSLYQVPLKVQVLGSYFELEQFVNKLEGLKRSFQVTGFTLEQETDPDAAAELKLTLDGRVFLSPPVKATTTPTTPVATAPAAQ